jgi:four helix bundle protein
MPRMTKMKENNENYNPKKFGKELEQRTKKFAIQIIRLSSRLPNTPEGRVVRNQLSKAGTSIGANYREANRARSKPDFRNKIKICESEASECQYWLEIIIEMEWVKMEETKSEFNESNELLALFTTIAKNSS